MVRINLCRAMDATDTLRSEHGNQGVREGGVSVTVTSALSFFRRWEMYVPCMPSLDGLTVPSQLKVCNLPREPTLTSWPPLLCWRLSFPRDAYVAEIDSSLISGGDCRIENCKPSPYDNNNKADRVVTKQGRSKYHIAPR
jgi:hypothetical protein